MATIDRASRSRRHGVPMHMRMRRARARPIAAVIVAGRRHRPQRGCVPVPPTACSARPPAPTRRRLPVFPADNPWNTNARHAAGAHATRRTFIKSITQPGHDEPAPRLRRRRRVRHPVQDRAGDAAEGARSTTPRTATRAIPGRSRSRRRADRRRVDQHRRPARHRGQQGTCQLYELDRAFWRGNHWDADVGRQVEPAVERVAAARTGRRPTRPGCRSSPGSCATTRSRAGTIDHALRFTAPRDAARRSSTRRRTTRRRRHEHGAAADGPAAAPEGELLAVAAIHGAGARDPQGAEEVRDDRRRQRIAAGSSPARPTRAGTTTTSTSSRPCPAPRSKRIGTAPIQH